MLQFRQFTTLKIVATFLEIITVIVINVFESSVKIELEKTINKTGIEKFLIIYFSYLLI